MTFIQRRLNVYATSWRCIDVEATLYRRHVSAGLKKDSWIKEKKAAINQKQKQKQKKKKKKKKKKNRKKIA